MLKKILEWCAGHRTQAFSIGAILVLVAGALIAWPILRHMETRQLALAAEQATQLMEDAMANPAIFSGEPSDAAAHLVADADQLARLHDGLVLAHVYFAPSAWRATLDYTEFAQRYVLKLAQVAAALRVARDATAQYDSAVAAFKFTIAKERLEAGQNVNQVAAEARKSTELAYQDCVLVHTLTTQVEPTMKRAMAVLESVGPDAAGAVDALLPRSEAAAADAHLARKPFNPMARPAF